jgi:WD40 repeat protein
MVTLLPSDRPLHLSYPPGDLYGQITLWDVDNGTPLGGPLPGGDGKATSLAFTVDANTLAAGDEDGTISTWEMRIGSWQARACRMIDAGERDLTDAERRQHLGVARVLYGSACGSVEELGVVKPLGGTGSSGPIGAADGHGPDQHQSGQVLDGMRRGRQRL